jgi:DNA primase
LKKGGANYVACCPFHSEKSPSFTVSPAKQFYHCFGCGAHGNAISFLMEYQGLGYIDAVKDLAESVGMKVPEAASRATRSEAGPDLYEIMQRASDYYREQLKAAPHAIEYLKGRGLTGKLAAQFGIGYAPEGWQNLESVFPDYAGKALKDAGLVIDAEGGGRRYDRFRSRIMFPILNQRGSVIAFGGRVIGEGEPKYLNSPETPLFEKGRELYGLTLARSAIREAGCVVVVEGYMDVVALAQNGIGYAVATLGTATSATHVQKLLRQTDEVVFCFDGDAAGRKAAWHALEVSLPCIADQKTLRFMFLPPEHDPDSFVREKGREVFEKELGEAVPLSAFFMDALKGRVNAGTAEGRAHLVHEAKPLLKQIAAPALQLQLLKALSEAAGMSQEETAHLTELRVPRSYRGASAPAPGADRGRQRVELKPERTLLKCLLSRPAYAKELATEILDAASPEGHAILKVVEYCRDHPDADGNLVVDHFPESELRTFLADSQADPVVSVLSDEDLGKEFSGAVSNLRERQTGQRLAALIAKENRTPEEDVEMLKLADRRKSGVATQNDATILGYRSNP